MNILHICLCGVVTDGLTYQDNLLPKYHKILGHKVYVITSKWQYDSNGSTYLSNCENYINNDGINVIRLNMKKKQTINSKFKRYEKLYSAIKNINPDIIFVHGCQFLDIKQIVNYAKKNKVTIYVDNHADFSNSAKNWLSKNILHKIVWRNCAKSIEPYVKKFYGVLPARVDFLINIYKIPKEKVELLVMGADDKYVEKYNNSTIREKERSKLNIKSSEFLIVTGGKIDKFKTQTLLLMKVMNKLDKNVKLLVFGSVDEELKYEFENLCKNQNITYLGWINEEASYKYFSIADLVVFPGRHSVYWEQVVALGIPMVCKYWIGTTHIDIGGNVDFIYDDSKIEDIIIDITNNKDKYLKMKENANKSEKNDFLYSYIAERSIR